MRDRNVQSRSVSTLAMMAAVSMLAACAGEEEPAPDPEPDPPVALPPPDPTPPAPPSPPAPVPTDPLDVELFALIDEQGLSGDPSIGRDLPSIEDPLAQLGKRLFFTQALGGEFDSACVSCHHPVLGGGDALSLSVGVHAVDPQLLGPGRGTVDGTPNVPRNAPSTFNIGLWDSSLFMDSRVESLTGTPLANGAGGGISTPDSGNGVIDIDAGANLTTAQARFPVTSVEEMRGDLLANEPNDALRAHLALRLGDVGSAAGEIGATNWLAEFQAAFASAQPAEELITYDNIALALAEYQRSQVFVNNPWREYVLGNFDAISDNAKRGAILFFTDTNDDGGGCVQCHSGDFFTNEEHHVIGVPQFGPGKGVGPDGDADFGRELVTGNPNERFRFRTPTLLNIEVTAPYMHTGAYETLDEVLDHYNNPNGTVNDFFDDGGWCDLDQFTGVADCESLYPNAEALTDQALARIQAERNADDPDALPNININNNERNLIEAFLLALTDPCVLDRDCLAPWISAPEEAADDHQINAVNVNGNPL